MGFAIDERSTLDPSTFKHVGQRQIGQHTVVAIAYAGLDVLVDALAHPGDALKVVHHTLGCTGRARGVQEDGDVGTCALELASQRFGTRRDRIPGLIVVFRRQWECNAGQAGRYATLLLWPDVEFSYKEKACTAVVKHVVNGLCSFSREDRNGCETSHPDRQLSHHEMRTVLGQNSNTGSGFEILCLQVSSHPAGLVHHLSPGVVHRLTAPSGLGHKDGVRVVFFVLEYVIEYQLG